MIIRKDYLDLLVETKDTIAIKVNTRIKKRKNYILLDEVQNVDKWEKAIED